ncbi:MAG TPA: NUDIX hydrolase, partial [Planctomycetota bacterium]|nr:NUDIX hydrolase [Planctomycetota bacterium]
MWDKARNFWVPVMTPYTYDYPRPSVTTDVVLVAPGPPAPRVLLIRRRSDPFRGQWALPGGFLEMDEELDACARRELLEETGIEVGPLLELGAYGTVGRDPRGRTISVVYLALAAFELPAIVAGDDASDAAWHPLDRLPRLAFDHADILAHAKARLEVLARTPGGLTPLLPDSATLADLRRVEAWLAAREKGKGGANPGAKKKTLSRVTSVRKA